MIVHVRNDVRDEDRYIEDAVFVGFQVNETVQIGFDNKEDEWIRVDRFIRVDVTP